MQKILIHIVLIGLLSGCSVYRAEVEQGNLVTAAELAKVKPGMNKKTVQRLLGTPILRDPFHNQRWDYYYALRKDGKEVERSLLTLTFDKDRLVKIEGKPSAH